MMDRYDRVSRVIGGVLREALRSTGATAILLLDAESPEGLLVTRIAGDAGLPINGYAHDAATLTAHPANKTALLVGDFFPRADLLPLGDLYATQVAALSGGWTGDDALHRLAGTLGGIEVLDSLLERHIEGRESLDVLAGLAEPARTSMRRALARTSFNRTRAGLVPKLGSRSIGVDLFD